MKSQGQKQLAIAGAIANAIGIIFLIAVGWYVFADPTNYYRTPINAVVFAVVVYLGFRFATKDLGF